MKPSARLIAALIATGTLPLTAGTTWDGGGSDANWGTAANWDDNNPPPVGTGVVLSFAGSTNLAPVNNYTAWDDFGGILFSSGAGSFNITGSSIDLFGKIENNSANLQTFGLEFSFNNASAEVNPVAGGLLLNGANIFNNGNSINIWGNNGHTATFDTVIQGGGGLTLNQNSTVILAKDNSYSGANTVTAGTLQIGNGGAIGNFGSGSMTIGASGTLAFNRTGNFNLGAISTSAGAKVRVSLGTVTGTAATSFGNQGSGNIVEINSGGAINLNGIDRSGNLMNLTIAGDGGGSGAIHNTGAAVYSNSGVRNVTLSNNATVTVGGTGSEGNRWDLRADGTLNLAGFNLTKNGGGNLVIRSTPGSGGTITVSVGTVGFEDSFTGAGTTNYNISVAAGAAVGGYNGRDIRSAVTLNGSTAALYDQGGTRSVFTNVTLNGGGRIDQSNRVYATTGNGLGINGTMGGTGNLTVSGGDRGLYLAGTHSFTGVTTIDIQSGHIELNGSANGGNLVSNAVLNLATTANNSRAMDLWGGNAEFRGLTGGNNNIRIVGNNATTRTLTINTPASESYTYSGIFENRTWNANASPYNLVKTGEGTQVFNNANSSWSGALTINGGTLTASGASGNTNTTLGLSSGSRTVTINNGGTLNLGSNNVFGGASQTLANTIKVAINAGGTMTTAVYNVVGNIDLNGGTLAATGGSSGGYQSYEFNGSTITVGGTAASTISASGSNSGMHIAGGKTLTLDVGDVVGGTDLTISAALLNGSNDRTGVGSLTKIGTGTFTITSAVTYTGNTTIHGGTMLIGTGGSLGNTAVTVGGTGASGTPTLAGGGTIGGATTIAAAGGGAAGTHAVGVAGVGNGIGSQSFSSDLSYGSGSTFAWDIHTGTDTSDGVTVGGNLAIASGAIFKVVSNTAFTDTFWDTSRTWNVFGGKNFGGFTLNYRANNADLNAGDFASEGYFTISGSSLNWTAVPEPGTALAGLLLTAGLLRRRRMNVKG
jgi:autotransporter-associated beta strand protein